MKKSILLFIIIVFYTPLLQTSEYNLGRRLHGVNYEEESLRLVVSGLNMPIPDGAKTAQYEPILLSEFLAQFEARRILAQSKEHPTQYHCLSVSSIIMPTGLRRLRIDLHSKTHDASPITYTYNDVNSDASRPPTLPLQPLLTSHKSANKLLQLFQYRCEKASDCIDLILTDSTKLTPKEIVQLAAIFHVTRAGQATLTEGDTKNNLTIEFFD